MKRTTKAVAALLAISLPRNVHAQETEAAGLPALEYQDYLVEQARKANEGQELPDLNLGGYRSGAWGEPVRSTFVQDKTTPLFGQQVRKDIGLDRLGAVRSVRWSAATAALTSEPLMEQLVERYGTPSVVLSGPIEEAIWIGAASTLTYRHANGEWSLMLVPTKPK